MAPVVQWSDNIQTLLPGARVGALELRALNHVPRKAMAGGTAPLFAGFLFRTLKELSLRCHIRDNGEEQSVVDVIPELSHSGLWDWFA